MEDYINYHDMTIILHITRNDPMIPCFVYKGVLRLEAIKYQCININIVHLYVQYFMTDAAFIRILWLAVLQL